MCQIGKLKLKVIHKSCNILDNEAETRIVKYMTKI